MVVNSGLISNIVKSENLDLVVQDALLVEVSVTKRALVVTYVLVDRVPPLLLSLLLGVVGNLWQV